MNNAASIGRSLSGVSLLARIAVCSLALTLCSQAQEPSINEGFETELDLIVEAEKVLKPGFFRDRYGSARRAEHLLKRVLHDNPTSPERHRVREDLTQVQEILALHNLQIAGFYLSKFIDHKGGSKGAESRLLEITLKYRRFSQMDEVLLLLGKLAIKDERPDDAAIYLWKLVCHYPNSSHRAAAFESLAEVGFRSPVCDCLEQ